LSFFWVNFFEPFFFGSPGILGYPRAPLGGSRVLKRSLNQVVRWATSQAPPTSVISISHISLRVVIAFRWGGGLGVGAGQECFPPATLTLPLYTTQLSVHSQIFDSTFFLPLDPILPRPLPPQGWWRWTPCCGCWRASFPKCPPLPPSSIRQPDISCFPLYSKPSNIICSCIFMNLFPD